MAVVVAVPVQRLQPQFQRAGIRRKLAVMPDQKTLAGADRHRFAVGKFGCAHGGGGIDADAADFHIAVTIQLQRRSHGADGRDCGQPAQQILYDSSHFMIMIPHLIFCYMP
ncbi:hypothetical protein SDC9_117115 [bioreactor metagenome]|uniref:Uncharacterized protein n=1 Tax=bioreactor metagenome TaxID=1076179 RepID=A0A645BXW5_9ZZZZ